MGKAIYLDQYSCHNLRTIEIPEESSIFDEDDDYTEVSYLVKLSQSISLPYDTASNFPIEFEEAYESLFEHVMSDSEHAINGVSYTQSEIPKEQAASNMRGQAQEWIPLLKLGWDNNVGFCFWDAGTITFLIHQEDLSRWNFSNLYSFLNNGI